MGVRGSYLFHFSFNLLLLLLLPPFLLKFLLRLGNITPSVKTTKTETMGLGQRVGREFSVHQNRFSHQCHQRGQQHVLSLGCPLPVSPTGKTGAHQWLPSGPGIWEGGKGKWGEERRSWGAPTQNEPIQPRLGANPQISGTSQGCVWVTGVQHPWGAPSPHTAPQAAAHDPSRLATPRQFAPRDPPGPSGAGEARPEPQVCPGREGREGGGG